ncbi:MAG: NAD(P)-dependent oxidoreductase [Chloroflexi bacterium HGW-Chloroflexi-10]|nr:MAG: NAD(P)-dependent oxidoreductase [Chloroflexi bacterium HGW-Chloroflexi-10]
MSAALNGKTVIITGGGSGIGQATAILFAQQGAQVTIFDIDSQAIATTIQNADRTPAIRGWLVDLTNPDEVSAAFQNYFQIKPRLDILVNVAGGSGRRWGDGPVDECSLEGWYKTLDLNLNSTFYCCKYALEKMKTQKSGVIVTVSSVLGLVGGDEDFATHAYAASKGASISLTRSIAAYYAPYGIRANVICPGLIATPMSQRAQNNQHIREKLVQLQPLTGDFGSPQDVAQAALYLASDSAAFVTGSVLSVDGGWTVR